jgi:hypothetical protein
MPDMEMIMRLHRDRLASLAVPAPAAAVCSDLDPGPA